MAEAGLSLSDRRNEEYSSVGENHRFENHRLKSLRTLFGWTQARLAEELEVDVSTVSRWERGAVNVSASQLARAREMMFGQLGQPTRLAQYVEAMLDEGLRREVEMFPGDRYILWGQELVMLAVSQYAIIRRPPLEGIKNQATASLIGGDLADIFEKRFKPLFFGLSPLPVGSSVLIYHRHCALLPGLPRASFIKQIAPLLFDGYTRKISNAAYDEQPEKFVIVYPVLNGRH